MENSGSFSLDSNLTHSFFSSFSSNISTTSTWKPILNSLQENQLLNRLILVRKARLQELSPHNQIPSHSRLSSEPFHEDLPSTEQDRLTEILLLSQRNLKILSIKVGSIPQNLTRAIELVLDEPSSMSTSQKFDCLSAIELLQEKLCDLALNSEEILSFFKDIALECEASASSPKPGLDGQEDVLAFADQREEIFQSKDLNRAKIQNLHRLIMNLESWKRRKGVFVEELDSHSRVQYDECVRATIEKLGQKEQEVIDIRNHYKASFDKVLEKVNALNSGLNRLRLCVNFELYSTWSCLIGQENSTEPSCHQVIGKIANFQQAARRKHLQVAGKFESVKRDVSLSKTHWTKIMADVNDLVLKSSQVIASKINDQEKYLRLVQKQLKQEQDSKERTCIELRDCLRQRDETQKSLNDAQSLLDEMKDKWKVEKVERNSRLGQVKIGLGALDDERTGLRDMVEASNKEVLAGFLKLGKVFKVLAPWVKLAAELKELRAGVRGIIDSETCKIRESFRSDVLKLLFIIIQLIRASKIRMQRDKSDIRALVQSWNDSLTLASKEFVRTCSTWASSLRSLEKEKKDLELQLSCLQRELSTLQSESESLCSTLKATEATLQARESSLETTEASLKKKEAALKAAESALKTTESALKNTEATLKTTETTLKTTEATLKTTEASLKTTETTLSQQMQLSKSSQSSLCQAKERLECELESLKLKHEALNLHYNEVQAKLMQKDSALSSLNEKCHQDSEVLQRLQAENESIKQDLDLLQKSSLDQTGKIDSLSVQLSIKDSTLAARSKESPELKLSLSQALAKLKSKSLEVASLESYLSSLNSTYQALSEACALKDSKLQRLKPVVSQLQSLQRFNQDTLRDLAELKDSHSKDLKALHDYLASSSSSQQDQSLAVLALEASHNSLELKQHELETQVFRLQESSSKYLHELNSIKAKDSQKLLKVKRKVRTFALVLAHERALVKDLHQDWMRYMRNSLESLRVVVESLQELRTSEEKKVKLRIERVCKDAQERVGLLEADMRAVQGLAKAKERQAEEKEELVGALEAKLSCAEGKAAEQDLALERMKEEIEDLGRAAEQALQEKQELGQELRRSLERIQELELEQENLARAAGPGRGLQEAGRPASDHEIARLEKEIDRLATGNSELLEQLNSELELRNECESRVSSLEKHELDLRISMEEAQLSQTKLENLNRVLTQNIQTLEQAKSSSESKISLLEDSLLKLEAFKQSQQLELGFLVSGKKFSDKLNQEENLLLKEKLEKTLKTLTSFRELNNILRSQVIKFLSSSSFDFEAFRIKLFEHVRLDIVKIKSNLESLKGKYTEERSILHVKIDAMKNSIDSNQDLVIPVKDFIKENQESIDALNETFEKTSQSYQQGIEENIKKVDDLQSKIEGYRIKGYELLNKYKRDSVLCEPEDWDPDLQEPGEAQGRGQFVKPERAVKSDTLSIDFNDGNRDASYSSFTLEEEPTSSLPNNELLSKADCRTRSSWRLPHLIKTLERYLNNKYRDDINALEKNREPLTMQEYLYQSLCNESKPLADKKLKELLNTFKENQHDRRIKFYCRLFQVYEPNPINYKLSLYIIQMRNEFNKFVSKQVIPEAHTKRVDKMQVLNLLGVARKLFGADLETGKVVLKYLKPENMLSTVWTITCLEYFLYKNMVPAECFCQITRQETMTEQEFVTGLSRMDTFVSEDDLQELFNSQFTGFISIDEFTRLFDLDSFFKRNQIYMVDQLHFLNSLIEGYNSMRIRHFKEVENLILGRCGKKLTLTYEEANQVLSELGSSAEQVFPKAAEVSTRDLKKKIFEMNIGSKGIGCYNLKAIKKISDTFEEKGP